MSVGSIGTRGQAPCGGKAERAHFGARLRSLVSEFRQRQELLSLRVPENPRIASRMVGQLEQLDSAKLLMTPGGVKYAQLIKNECGKRHYENAEDLGCALSDLRQNGLLTQENLALLTQDLGYTADVAAAIRELERLNSRVVPSNRILRGANRQKNFQMLIKNAEHARALAGIFSTLIETRVMNPQNDQQIFDLLVENARYARFLQRKFSELHKAGQLNPANVERTIESIRGPHAAVTLGLLNAERAEEERLVPAVIGLIVGYLLPACAEGERPPYTEADAAAEAEKIEADRIRFT